jgi:protein-arginine kinase activator protein McsA
MDEAAFVPDEEEEENAQPSRPQKSKQPETKMSKLEQLHHALKEAIEKENYEKAALLRDEIRRLELRG